MARSRSRLSIDHRLFRGRAQASEPREQPREQTDQRRLRISGMAVRELVAYPLRDARPLEMILCAVLEHVQRTPDDRARQRALEGMQQHLEILADARLRLRVAARERVDRERTDMTLIGLHQHRGELWRLYGCARGALEEEPRQRISQQ